MSLSQHAPSPFAALLRRSKFASYDPKIGQIYTTYGGHAHRGNWGFKRPLLNRRPSGFIFMRKVDTPEQQSEWDTAESSARWIKRWDEMAKTLGIPDLARWRPTVYSLDSDFDSIPKNGFQVQISDLKRQLADMTPKQFEKYLERLRKRRPAFKEFLKARYLEEKRSQTPLLDSQRTGLIFNGDHEVDMFASGQENINGHINSFLISDSILSCNESQDSRMIYPSPQRYAGLEYTHMSQSQALYLAKPLPGRIVYSARGRAAEQKRTAVRQLVVAGGVTGQLRSSDGFRTPTDFGSKDAARRHREQGKDMFILHHVDLIRPPLVVGKKPETVKAAQFDGIHFALAEKGLPKEDPHSLGSADYVASEKRSGSQPDVGTLNLLYRRSNQKSDQSETEKSRSHNKLLHKLSTLTKNQKVDEP